MTPEYLRECAALFQAFSHCRPLAAWLNAQADAMLRERERTNLDAAPAAIATSDEDRPDKPTTSHRDDGTGDTRTLTDEERQAVEGALYHWEQCADSVRGLPTDVRIEAASRAATLRALLARLGGDKC